MRRAALLLPIALAALAACERQASAGAGSAAPEAAVPDTLPLRFSRNLVGTVGGQRVDVWLRREGDLLSGTWLVEEDVEKWMSGTMDSGGTVNVPIYVETEDAPEATLEGTLAMTGDGVSLTGRLVELDGEALPVTLAEERIPLGKGLRLEPAQWMEDDAEMGWSVAVELPIVVAADGAKLPPAHAAFNAAADSLARDHAGPFLEEVLTWEAPFEDAGASVYESSYEVTYADESLVSIVSWVSVYFAGTAHPNHPTWTLTWDFETGRRVALSDLFRPGAPYLQVLSDAAIPLLVEELGTEMADEEWVAEGAAPAPESFVSWSLAPEGLQLVFDPYRVAAYAAGPQIVVIRWSALEPHLDPAGPVARIAR